MKKIVVRFPIETLKKGEFLLEQYTGLKDKNGKEIYEGDIMTTFDGKLNAVIIWRNNTAGWGIKWTDTDIEDSLMHRMGGLNPSIRLSNVIGNIHENPELCGEEKE